MKRYYGMENPDDLRKTVRIGKNSSNKSWKKISIFIIAIAIIVGIIFAVKLNSKTKITAKEVKNFNYFITTIDGKSGVIDKKGNVVINNEYDYVQIPNPEKPVFICLYDYNTETMEYSSKVLNENKKEILSKYEKVQAIPNNNTSISNPYQTEILQYKSNGKYGLITLSGSKITDAIYDSIETLEYKDGILKVKKDGLYGLIDLSGSEIVGCEYSSITTDGYYNTTSKYEQAGFIVTVRKEEGYRYGYINNKGKPVLDTIYTNIKRITEIKEDDNVYLLTYRNGKAGMLKNGQTIIENEFENIEYDSVNAILAVQKNAKQGIYDLKGKEILPISYDEIAFAGKYINATKDGEFMVFDGSGTLQQNDSYKSIQPVANGKYNITIDRANKYGVVDANRTIVISNEYTYIEYAFDDNFIVSKDGKSGLVSCKDNFNILIPIEKNIIQNIKGTRIIQTIDSNANTSEIYNQNIEKVLTRKDARIYIKDDYIEIATQNSIDYLDFNGNIKDAKDIFNNQIIAKEKDGKWGYVDRNGNTVVYFKYDMATNINEYGFGAVKQNGKWGVIDGEGKIIKEPVYEIDDLEPQFVGEYYMVSNIYQISYYTK